MWRETLKCLFPWIPLSSKLSAHFFFNPPTGIFLYESGLKVLVWKWGFLCFIEPH